MTNRNDYGAGTPNAPPFSNTIGENVGSGGSAVFGLSKEGDLTGLGGNGKGMIPLALTNPRKKMIFPGDSLSFQGSDRAPGIFNGTLWKFATTFVNTNLGAGSWVVTCKLQSSASNSSSSLLRTDGFGNLQYAYNANNAGGDSYGPLVNVSKTGGWFLLQSSNPASPMLQVSVRGATTPPTSAGTGNVTCSGAAVINDWNPMGYATWVAGALADTFYDYECFGISGATTADILKFTPQIIASSGTVEAVVLVAGINDVSSVSSAATGQVAAAAAISNLQAIIQLYLNSGVRRVYVGDIFPYPGAASAFIQQYAALISTAMKAYCRVTQGCVFWSAWDKLSSPTSTTGSAARTGCFNPADNLHLMPYGGWITSTALVPKIQADYYTERGRKCDLDVYDSVLNVGVWNANPTLRGTGGTVTGGGNITGTAPDSWTIALVGATAACTTSTVTATDFGVSWYTMAVSGATSGDYHQLSQTVTIPSGVTVGSYFRLTVEMSVGAMAVNGLAFCECEATTNTATQAAYLLQYPTANRNIATFAGTEGATLMLQSEPMLLLAGSTNFTMALRIGADPQSGSTGTVGFRNFRIESCPGPIYP